MQGCPDNLVCLNNLIQFCNVESNLTFITFLASYLVIKIIKNTDKLLLLFYAKF